MLCDNLLGPDSGGAHWICKKEYLAGHILVKSDGLYLLDVDNRDIKKLQDMDNPGEEENETREVIYCPSCHLWSEKE